MRKIIVVERYIGFSFAMFVGLSVCLQPRNPPHLPHICVCCKL